MGGASRLRFVVLGAFALLGASCSVIFSTDDLSNGTSSGETVTICAHDGECDDGDPCTRDSCDPMTKRCAHAADVGARCGPSTDCTPQGACNAEARCVAAEPDPSRCDDHNDCTIDSCEAGGCRHVPVEDGGDGCDDGDACHITTCSEGKCVGVEPKPVQFCNGSSDPCPAGTYRLTYRCDMIGCGPSCICSNAYFCTKACGDSFMACCDLATGSCEDACGGSTSNYEQSGAEQMIDGCTCVKSPGVKCVKKGQ